MKTRSTIDYKSAKTVNICIIRKTGYAHTEGFREAAERIEEECRRREISCKTTGIEDEKADLNIVFGSHLETEQTSNFNKSKCLIVNLERLRIIGEVVTNEAYIQILNNFNYIDFSSDNIEYCKKNKISIPLYLYRPWHEGKWKRIINEIEKTWDVCLIGSITPRRQTIINRLKQSGLSVTSRFNCYSYERDEILSKSKVCINIHAYEDDKTAEIWRLNYLATNQVRVISETCRFETGEEEINDALTQASYEDIANYVISCINQETCIERGEQARTLYGKTKEHDYKYENHQYPSENKQKPTLLNIGCGENWREDAINIDIKNTGFEDLILDISQTWSEVNNKWQTKRFGEVHLNENGFDAIEASCVLEYVEDLTTSLVNIIKLLKPGGWLYLKFAHQDSLGAWQNPKHLRGMNENLIKYLDEYGYYLGLGDMRAAPKWIKLIEEEQNEKLNMRDKTRIGFVETVLVKRVIEIRSNDEIKSVVENTINDKRIVGTSSLRESLHRRTYIQSSTNNEIADSSPTLQTVSLQTPTFGQRFKYLGLTWKWINEQSYPHDLMEWVILTDTDEEANALVLHMRNQTARPSIHVVIKSAGRKLLIGEKRNTLHTISSGDILINFDDDDYYFPDRVSHAVEALTNGNNNGSELAGCQYLPVFFTNDGTLWISDPGANKACAGSFAYKRSLIRKTWYPNNARAGEEIGFTDYWDIPKIDLDPFSTMVCIAHENNTFDKNELRSRFEGKDSETIRAMGNTYKGDRNFFMLNEFKEDKNINQKDWQRLYLKAGKLESKCFEVPEELFKEPKQKNLLDRLTDFTIERITTKQ